MLQEFSVIVNKPHLLVKVGPELFPLVGQVVQELPIENFFRVRAFVVPEGPDGPAQHRVRPQHDLTAT